MNRLENKVAVITGGCSGMGKAIVDLFDKEGAKVIVGDINADNREENGRIYRTADIRNREAVEELVRTAVNEYGKLDIMVCDAGVLDKGLKAIDHYEDADMDIDLDINTKGTAMCMRAAVTQMLKQGYGSIVNMASVSGIIGNASAPYVASKAAVIGLTTHAAYRLASDHIRVNAICPGSVATPMAMIDPATLDQIMLGTIRKHSDLKVGVCTPEEIANIALFLASDESSALSGQIIAADKGVNL